MRQVPCRSAPARAVSGCGKRSEFDDKPRSESHGGRFVDPGSRAARTRTMDSAYFSAFAALAGSVIGGLTSLGTSWLTQHSQLGEQRSVRNLERRETLYKDFISEASRLYVDAFEHEQTDLSNLVRLFAMISQMRIVSAPRVVEDADKVAQLILETYLAPNK